MRYLRIFAILVVLIAGAWIVPQETFAQQGNENYQLFYDQLSPYGMWVNNPDYGYVWLPNVDASFSPYATNGHWIYTEDGWTWISDYPWGWATFHYGRWAYDNVYGWLWVPGNEWGPAWVSWRSSPGYYGWAPLGPGISIDIAFGSNYHEQNDRWIFVRDRNFTSPNISNYYINRTKNITIINNSRVIVNTRKGNTRNVTYIAGPQRKDVQRFIRTPVKSVPIREINQPGQHLSNGMLQIYRPQVSKVNNNVHKPAPSKVMRLNEVKPLAERNIKGQQRGTNKTNNARKYQQPVSRNVKPTNNSRVEKKPQRVTQPKKNTMLQHVQPKVNQNNKVNRQRGVNPANNVGKYKQPASRNVKPINVRGMEKKPQRVTPSRKNTVLQHAQPKNNQRKQIIKKQEINKIPN